MAERARVLLITDRRRTPRPLIDLPDLVARALSGAAPGTVLVQLREKDLDARPLCELARALLPICRARGARLLINDRLDIALALDLDGLHLPASSFTATDARRLLPAGKLLGVSCHSVEEVAAAREGGADYAAFGPLFDTPSKRELGTPLGLESLTRAATLGLPLFGIGGVTVERTAAVRAGGAHGVAVIGAWMSSPDPAAAVQALLC